MTDRRILLTGATGFVGPYVISALRAALDSRDDILASSRSGGSHPVLGDVLRLDVTDSDAADSLIAKIAPTHVIHLAALAAIPSATANADLAWRVHLFGTLNVANAILRRAPGALMLHIGSGQVYGSGPAAAGTALTESTLLAPNNVYTASKAAADLALGALGENGLRSVRFRPFNHIGPGQSEDFAISSFAMQIARIRRGLKAPVIRVGNIAVERDFLDVRDVASAYVAAVLGSDRLKPGLILNVSSGNSYRVGDLLDRLVSIARLSIAIEVDQSRLRSNDVHRFVGDAALARRTLDWAPRFTIDETLTAILADADGRVDSLQRRSAADPG